jgi:hypothetical protein
MRRAYTLAEVLIAVVLLVIAVGIATATMGRQTRASRAAAELAELRDQLREGAGTLATDLAQISPAGGDIYGAMQKSSLEFRSVMGSSVACIVNPAGSLSIPANADVSPGTRLTWLYKRVDPGHGVLIFDEGASHDADDDAWLFRTIISVASHATACTATPFAGASSQPGMMIGLNAGLPGSVTAGAPVRFVERVRYALYQSSDSKWYIGYCASNTMSSSCGTLQPVSGPYLPPSADQNSGTGGLDLYYFDESGLPTLDPARVARIDIAVRGVTRGGASLAGSYAAAPIRDTLRVSVAVRNR